jgi:hypothetical protein
MSMSTMLLRERNVRLQRYRWPQIMMADKIAVPVIQSATIVDASSAKMQTVISVERIVSTR